jgi:quinol monooxygenase YgiN
VTIKTVAIKKKLRQADFVVIWEFRVRSGKRREFEVAYGPDGAWVNLFRRDREYIRTELIHDRRNPRRYLTIDVWSSREAYLRFKKRNQDDYDELDRNCASLTESEVKIGEFHRVAGPRQSRS